LDACSGSGATSRNAAKLGFKVIANDILTFPSVVANGSIGLTETQQKVAANLIERINKVSGLKGYFYNNFCEKSTHPRKYFTSENAQLIDHFRQEIERITDPKIKDYLLYCALEAMSRVSNTTGVQAAFLKQYKDRAKDRIKLRVEPVVPGEVVATHSDILTLLNDTKFRQTYREDILYIDPPYNQRQYGPNYHLYETFVCGDNPTANGKTGLRDWKAESASKFCVKKECVNFLVNIVALTTAKFVFISYNSDGLLTTNDVYQALNPTAIVHMEKIGQRRYKSDTATTRTYNQDELYEYLFVVEPK
jgi:adenine-specific DNA-methyltransferase